MTAPGAYLQLLLAVAAFLFWWLAAGVSAIGILACLVRKTVHGALAFSALTIATCWAMLVPAHQILLLVRVG